MNSRRFVSVAVVIGVAIPVVWLVAYRVLLQGNPATSSAVLSEGHLRALLAVWPSWLLLMADPEERSLAVPAISIACNALLYGVVGWSIWFGLNRRRYVLVVTAVFLAVGWYGLDRWMYGGA
jgi:hypothetical protein